MYYLLLEPPTEEMPSAKAWEPLEKESDHPPYIRSGSRINGSDTKSSRIGAKTRRELEPNATLII